jgi:transcriptional regulator with XRE-family HTH domain
MLMGMLDLVPAPLAPEDQVPAVRLTGALEASGMSQSELARRLGVTQGTVNRWCRGKAPISMRSWIAAAAVMGLPASWEPRVDDA